MSLHKEINFETEICQQLAEHGWLYAEGDAASYDRARAGCVAPRHRAHGKFVLLPSPACGRGAGGEGEHWSMMFLQRFPLSRKRARGQKSVATSSILINQLQGEQIYRGIELLGLKKPLKLARLTCGVWCSDKIYLFR